MPAKRTEKQLGNRHTSTTIASDPVFTGKEEDVEVGLQYFGKRFLNPLLGRWISADPLAVHAPGSADSNLYAYVSGAVLKNVDPLGLEAVVNAQHSDEYRKKYGARGTANTLAASMGVARVGVHWKSRGLLRQVVRENVDRIDPVGHFASDFALKRSAMAKGSHQDRALNLSLRRRAMAVMTMPRMARLLVSVLLPLVGCASSNAGVQAVPALQLDDVEREMSDDAAEQSPTCDKANKPWRSCHNEN